MIRQKRWGLVAASLLVGAVAALSLALVASAQADPGTLSPSSPPISAVTRLSQSDDPPPLGEPCGSGEQLPPWVICLHGTVSLIHPPGQVEPLDGAQITVTLGGRLVTGTTFIHPGQITPTYGVDISPLEPAFLKPVTLTAVVSDVLVQRQVVVFPDFATQNQQFDVRVLATGALDPASVWGHVVAFSAGGPVTDALVVAERDGMNVQVTTTVQAHETLPIYTLSAADLASIGATAGSAVTLTAYYGSDADRRSVTLSDEPLQVNFTTGWHCDDFDPLPRTGGGYGLPRTGGGYGLPRTGGGYGLPDIACFWGHGLVNGIPATEMSVQLMISDTIHGGQTRLYPGESAPRYSIAVWGGQAISGQLIVATGIYSGYTDSKSATATLDADLSQRVDFSVIARDGSLVNILSANSVYALAWQAGYLWAGTVGGVVRLDPSDGSSVQFTTDDGLVDNTVFDVAGSPDGSLWFGTGGGVSHYTPSSGEWETFTTTHGLAADYVSAVAVDADGSLWFATWAGISHYTPGGNPEWEDVGYEPGDAWATALSVGTDGSLWIGTDMYGIHHYTPTTDELETFTTADGLPSDSVNDVAIGDDGSLWFGTGGGVSHYTPTATVQWETFTTTHGLANSDVRAVGVGTNGSLWFGTVGGASHYSPTATAQWETFTTTHGLANDHVEALATGVDGSLWFISQTGEVSHYTPGGNPEWETFDLVDGLIDNHVRAIAIGTDGSLWFGTDHSGVSHYTPGSNPAWETFTTTHGLVNNRLRAIGVGIDGSLWFGTQGGVSHYTPITGTWETLTITHGLVDYSVQAVAVGTDGSLWFGTPFGLSRYTPDTEVWETFTTTHGLVGSDVRAIAVGTDGSLWFGTAAGASHYTPGTSMWESFTTTHGLAHDDVRAIAVSADGSPWFGTRGGVSHYSPGGSPEWESFTTADGLASNYVAAIAVGTDGSLWIGTEQSGVSHYTPGGSPEWENFTTADGLASDNVEAIAVGTDGSLWIGTQGGVNHWGNPTSNADLSVQMDGPPAALAGQVLTYTIQLANYGQASAAHTTLTLTLPLSVTYVDATPPPSTTTPLAWSLGSLPAGSQPLTLVVTATLDAGISPGTILTTTANAATTAPETFLPNNASQLIIYIRDPDRADVRVSLAGPPLLIPGTEATYDIWVDNFGGLDAQTTTLTIAPDTGLDCQVAVPPPSSLTPLIWDLGTLPAIQAPIRVALTFTVSSAVPVGTDLATAASITTTTPDGNPLNNTAVVTVSTSLTDALTLILVPSDRLVAQYGASPLFSRLQALADHPYVRGVILDVLDDTGVQSAYTVWDADPGNWQKANDVAQAIKALIDQYTINYPSLRYLVIVGDDEIIPYYRIEDQNHTSWQERGYAIYVSPGTVRSALAANMLLSDDFYADRTPTVPSSDSLSEGHLLYLPDFATGRLVETPEEIVAVIDSFLDNDGTISLEPGLVGTLDHLTDDLGDAQCAALDGDGLAVTCTDRLHSLHQEFLSQSSGSAWVGVHSNHFSLGILNTADIVHRAQAYTQTLLSTIGCHAGLNVPASASSLPDLDLVQAFAGQGGTTIAPTAYAYASQIDLEYSEALAMELTHQLLVTQTQEIGPALVRAKQVYYADRGWFDYLDEKVLVPVTLYGLPMLRVTTPDSLLKTQTVQTSLPNQVQRSTTAPGAATVVTYTISGLTFTQHTLNDGIYYDHAGQIVAQDSLPIQPASRVPLSTTLAGETIRGVVLRSATYAEYSPFDPLISQSWVIGEERSAATVEPPVMLTGWDRDMPYALGYFEGVLDTIATLNLVLGAYDGDRQAERLFDGLVLQVLYSNNSDRVAPTISSYRATIVQDKTLFHVSASDEAGLAQIVVVYDDGLGNWRSVELAHRGDNTWEGQIDQPATRFYVQAVDINGNVSNGMWTLPLEGYQIYLPITVRDGS